MTEKKKRATRAEVEALEKRVSLLTSELEFAREQIRRNSSLRETIDDERNYNQALLELTESELSVMLSGRLGDLARAKILEQKIRDGLRKAGRILEDEGGGLQDLVEITIYMLQDAVSRLNETSLKLGQLRDGVLGALAVLGVTAVWMDDDEIVRALAERVRSRAVWRPLSEAPEGEVILVYESFVETGESARALPLSFAKIENGELYYCQANGEISAGPFTVRPDDQWIYPPEISK